MKMFARCLIRKTGRYLSFAAVAGAAAGLVYNDKLHVSFAIGAAGGICLAAGWFAYTGKHLPWKPRYRKIPDFLKKKDTARHIPAFRMDYRDFDDDLNSLTSVDEDALTEKQQKLLKPSAYFLSAVICFVLSQFMPL